MEISRSPSFVDETQAIVANSTDKGTSSTNKGKREQSRRQSWISSSILAASSCIAAPLGLVTWLVGKRRVVIVGGHSPGGVDTDLEVDIEALNEEQARETLRYSTYKI